MSADYELPTLLESLQLRALPAQLPALLADARAQQMTSEGFLQRVLVEEVRARDRRAFERRLQAAKLPGHKSASRLRFRVPAHHLGARGPRAGGSLVYPQRHECRLPGSARRGEDAFKPGIAGQSAGSRLLGFLHDAGTGGPRSGGRPVAVHAALPLGTLYPAARLTH